MLSGTNGLLHHLRPRHHFLVPLAKLLVPLVLMVQLQKPIQRQLLLLFILDLVDAMEGLPENDLKILREIDSLVVAAREVVLKHVVEIIVADLFIGQTVENFVDLRILVLI